jgi:hypothetical protein
MDANWMPMMYITGRFEGTAPTRIELEAAFERLRGSIAPLEEITFTGSRVRILSMDPIALVYAHRAIIELGGEPAQFDGTPRDLELPEWSERPWQSHGFLRRLRIRFSSFAL